MFRFQDKDLHMESRLNALKLYRAHLMSQYADRCAVWCLRDISGPTMSRTVVCVTDGADQAPWICSVVLLLNLGRHC